MFKSLKKFWHRVTDIASFGKHYKYRYCFVRVSLLRHIQFYWQHVCDWEKITFWNVFRSYSERLFKLGAISFKEYASKQITIPVFYGDVIDKFRRSKGASDLIMSDSKTITFDVDNMSNNMTSRGRYVVVLGNSRVLYRPLQKRCTLTNMVVGTIWRTCSNLRRRRPWSSPPLIVSHDSFSPLTWARIQMAHPSLTVVAKYFWFTTCIFFCDWLGCWFSVSIREITYTFLNMCLFDYTAFLGIWKVGRPSTG